MYRAQAFLTQILRQCERAGHVRGDRLCLDGELTTANANLDSMGPARSSPRCPAWTST
jgi:hypothetical protein